MCGRGRSEEENLTHYVEARKEMERPKPEEMQGKKSKSVRSSKVRKMRKKEE